MLGVPPPDRLFFGVARETTIEFLRTGLPQQRHLIRCWQLLEHPLIVLFALQRRSDVGRLVTGGEHGADGSVDLIAIAVLLGQQQIVAGQQLFVGVGLVLVRPCAVLIKCYPCRGATAAA